MNIIFNRLIMFVFKSYIVCIIIKYTQFYEITNMYNVNLYLLFTEWKVLIADSTKMKSIETIPRGEFIFTLLVILYLTSFNHNQQYYTIFRTRI